MKKTIWQPLVLGIILGSLAGVSMVTGFTFLTPGLATNAIGFYMILLLLSAALGGPLAGVVASSSMIIISALFGLSEMKAIITIPSIFWSNMLALGMIEILIGYGYRFIFERMKMPFFLVGWSLSLGIYYVILAVLQVTLYIIAVPGLGATYVFYFNNIPVELTLIIVITSLLLLGLPARYRKPQWYELKKVPDQNGAGK